MSHSHTLAAAVIALAAFAGAENATAQVNCNVLPHGQARANCYGREAQIYRQQAQNYNDIANQQYRVHQQVGTALRAAPLIGRYAAPAWNAPRYVYNSHNWARGRR
jgi:hypothetical protein